MHYSPPSLLRLSLPNYCSDVLGRDSSMPETLRPHLHINVAKTNPDQSIETWASWFVFFLPFPHPPFAHYYHLFLSWLLTGEVLGFFALEDESGLKACCSVELP